MKKLEVSLISSGDGTEIIHHKLEADGKWGLTPQEGWDALEHITLLSGKLRLQTEKGERILVAGDSYFECPVTNSLIFHAEEETEFLYISSRPVFHIYSHANKKTMDLAVAIEEKDGYTADHCYRIAQMSMMVGEQMGLDPNQLVKLNLSSFFHDVGKVKVPLTILQKPGKLTSEEWEIMKLHTTYGREILEETNLPLLKKAGEIVEQHHERYDGKGYPKGLTGDKIAIEAEIISIVDSYDAMTTDRIYQKGRTKEAALEEIKRCSGTMYNPEVVKVFLSLKEKLN
ncbi:HD domain-containing phosphohydrolase [Brevibacillus ginsengisoli]|uniref:HD domain-containing phosphohydrolase n=1 Tax=Brevibacillus ginsengisoli TaxID=363854 RepID=UPI003CE7BA3A